MDVIANIMLTVAQVLSSWDGTLSTQANMMALLKGFGINVGIFMIVTPVFWLLFVAGMNIERVYKNRMKDGRKWHKAFHPAVWLFAGPAVAALLVVDVLFRYTYGVVIYFPYFRGFFHDYTLSNMLNAILSKPIYKGTWRYKLSKWIAIKLINDFSYDGKHIRLPLEPGWGA